MKNDANHRRELLARLLNGDGIARRQLQKQHPTRSAFADWSDEELNQFVYEHNDFTPELKQRLYTDTPYPHYDFEKLTGEELREIILGKENTTDGRS
ncbi:hypothetical protein [Larkinella soli]|uniref:hypothetical protein n=1 Tax=Larkinella soli TaxID=1770527 RepID=UPI000FFC9C0D|nr:hypothetical protein [Larkinella soli]